MSYEIYVLGSLMVAALIYAAVAHTRALNLKNRLAEFSADSIGQIERLRQELTEAKAEAVKEAGALRDHIAARTAAETRVDELQKALTVVIGERDKAYSERNAALQKLLAAEKDVALKEQEIRDIQLRMSDWEKTKAEGIQAVKAAALSTATELSTKLLNDHKREAEAAKKEADALIKKTAESLVGQVSEMAKTVIALHSQVADNRETTETIWRALSTPGGSGYFAQIGLGNTLKSFGLMEGRDFILDKAIEGRRLRPDAVVFLPGDTLLVIDCKASKFLLEVAEAEKNGAGETEALEKLAQTMNQHLKGLIDRNYEAEIRSSYREAGKTNEVKRIISVMYLPNEGAVERVGRADPDFARRAAESRIVLAGPTALACLIGFASVEIDLGRRAESQELIIETTQQLLNNITVILDYAVDVGRGLKTASDKYAKLVGSVNTRLLPQTRKLMQQGIKPTRQKAVIPKLPVFQVLMDEGQYIDAAVEEIGILPSGDNESEDQS